MQNQKFNNLQIINLSQFKSILSLYFFTIGTSLLGFSIYLLIEALGMTDNNITSWSGQSLFWGFIIFFVAIFLLFLPIEFFQLYKLINRSFSELISNILFTIGISLFFLIFVQLFLPNTSDILIEVSAVLKATSFSGFIIVPLVLFLLNNLNNRITVLNSLGYDFILLVWIFGTLIFI